MVLSSKASEAPTCQETASLDVGNQMSEQSFSKKNFEKQDAPFPSDEDFRSYENEYPPSEGQKALLNYLFPPDGREYFAEVRPRDLSQCEICHQYVCRTSIFGAEMLFSAKVTDNWLGEVRCYLTSPHECEVQQ